MGRTTYSITIESTHHYFEDTVIHLVLAKTSTYCTAWWDTGVHFLRFLMIFACTLGCGFILAWANIIGPLNFPYLSWSTWLIRQVRNLYCSAVHAYIMTKNYKIAADAAFRMFPYGPPGDGDPWAVSNRLSDLKVAVSALRLLKEPFLCRPWPEALIFIICRGINVFAVFAIIWNIYSI